MDLPKDFGSSLVAPIAAGGRGSYGNAAADTCNTHSQSSCNHAHPSSGSIGRGIRSFRSCGLRGGRLICGSSRCNGGNRERNDAHRQKTEQLNSSGPAGFFALSYRTDRPNNGQNSETEREEAINSAYILITSKNFYIFVFRIAGNGITEQGRAGG